MKTEEFINQIKSKRDYFYSGVVENLIAPPGRKPRQKDLNLSHFYNSLSEKQKETLNEIIYESIDTAIFGILGILDHVSFLEDTEEKTQFELYAIKEGERVLINDSSKEDLHDMYNALVLDD